MEFIQKQGLCGLSLVCGALVLSPTVMTVFLVVFLGFQTYFLHYVSHQINESSPLWFMANHHVTYHHHGHHDGYNMTIEFLQNFLFAGGFNALIGFYLPFFNPIVCIFIGLFYAIYHMVHLTLLKQSPQHIAHHTEFHKGHHCNYGPDILDHLFGTNCDNTVEEMNKYSLTAIVLATVLYYLQNLKK